MIRDRVLNELSFDIVRSGLDCKTAMLGLE